MAKKMGLFGALVQMALDATVLTGVGLYNSATTVQRKSKVYYKDLSKVANEAAGSLHDYRNRKVVPVVIDIARRKAALQAKANVPAKSNKKGLSHKKIRKVAQELAIQTTEQVAQA